LFPNLGFLTATALPKYSFSDAKLSFWCLVSEKNTCVGIPKGINRGAFKSEQRITELIQGRYPSHNILGEENGFINNAGKYSWIIDPLDGTSNYAAHIPWFGVLIALLENSKPILAGAYLPISDELYHATADGGAFKNDQPIDITRENELKNILCCYSLDFSEDQTKTDAEVQIINLIAN